MKPRAFWPVLLGITLVGFIIRVYVGLKTFIDFDEWQHLFMASSARWQDLQFELQTNAHPPLFFLLLKGVLRLGHVSLYRSVSILAGVGSIVIMGFIAKRVLQSPILQLLCAAVFALSIDAIAISTEIRSYQLAVFLCLLALLFWLDMSPDADGKVRAAPCIGFAICSTLAVSSHYSAVFFLGACLLTGLMLFRRIQRASLWLIVSAIALPCAVFAVEYFIHAGTQPIQGYLMDYYRGSTPDESTLAFIVRNCGNFFSLFSPVELHNPAAFLPAILILFAAAAWALRTCLRERKDRSAAAILIAALIAFEILAAALDRKYPFGGLLRHQYIAGPFLLLAAFVVVDTLVDSLLPLASATLRRAIPAILLAVSGVNLIVEFPKLIVYPGVTLLDAEYNSWTTAFPHATAVYLDHWSVIGYFIHTSDQPRTFVRTIPDAAVIDQYHVPGKTGNGTEIFYDKTRNSLNLADPSLYRSFADCLRASSVPELTLLFYSPGDKRIDQDQENLERTIAARADDNGLILTGIAITKTSLAAGFKLK